MARAGLTPNKLGSLVDSWWVSKRAAGRELYVVESYDYMRDWKRGTRTVIGLLLECDVYVGGVRQTRRTTMSLERLHAHYTWRRTTSDDFRRRAALGSPS